MPHLLVVQAGTAGRAHDQRLTKLYKVFQHAFDEPFTDDASHARQLLVAASPHDEVADHGPGPRYLLEDPA